MNPFVPFFQWIRNQGLPQRAITQAVFAMASLALSRVSDSLGYPSAFGWCFRVLAGAIAGLCLVTLWEIFHPRP